MLKLLYHTIRSSCSFSEGNFFTTLPLHFQDHEVCPGLFLSLYISVLMFQILYIIIYFLCLYKRNIKFIYYVRAWQRQGMISNNVNFNNKNAGIAWETFIIPVFFYRTKKWKCLKVSKCFISVNLPLISIIDSVLRMLPCRIYILFSDSYRQSYKLIKSWNLPLQTKFWLIFLRPLYEQYYEIAVTYQDLPPKFIKQPGFRCLEIFGCLNTAI